MVEATEPEHLSAGGVVEKKTPLLITTLTLLHPRPFDGFKKSKKTREKNSSRAVIAIECTLRLLKKLYGDYILTEV